MSRGTDRLSAVFYELSRALPFTPGLFIKPGIGKVSLPITDGQAKDLKANSWKTNDDGTWGFL